MDLDDSVELNYNTVTESPEEEIDEIVNNMVRDKDKNYFNFLINASNQANLANTSDLTYSQINALFVLVYPYSLENFDIEGLNLDIKMSEDGSIYIDGKNFEAVEIQPGIKILGIVKK